jgi:hypothetical protein
MELKCISLSLAFQNFWMQNYYYTGIARKLSRDKKAEAEMFLHLSCVRIVTRCFIAVGFYIETEMVSQTVFKTLSFSLLY